MTKHIFSAFLLLLLLAFSAVGSATAPEPANEALLQKYSSDAAIDQILCIRQREGYNTQVTLYQKDSEAKWQVILDCGAFGGRNGFGKEREGDEKVPVGDFGILTAFGIKDNPGTALPYLKLNEYHYCSGNPEYYNQIVDEREVVTAEEMCGEHLIECDPEYTYAIFYDYNIEHIVGKGSALFIHCKGAKIYTAGCIALDEADMVTLLRKIKKNARILIYP